jgi:hypothetical protein
MENNTTPSKTKKKFIDIDLDLNFKKTESNLENVDLNQQADDIEEEMIDETELEDLNSLKVKGPKKHSTTQELQDKVVNNLFNEIFDEKIKSWDVHPSKSFITLNSTEKKGIKECRIIGRELAIQCCEVKFTVELIDYKEGKFFSMICPHCMNYLVLYYENVNGVQAYGTYRGVTIILTLVDLEIECVCGYICGKNNLTAIDSNFNKKCESCGQIMSLYGCSIGREYTYSPCLNFSLSDLSCVFKKYGFCTSDITKYGYKLRVESVYERDYEWIGEKRVEIVKTHKKLVVEKIQNIK